MTTSVEMSKDRRARRRGALLFEVIAAQHLRADARASSAWVAEGEDPAFLLATAGRKRRIFGGLVRIRADLRPLDGTMLDPVLYYADGTGFSEAKTISLRATAAGIDELIVLPEGVSDLRVDPMAGSGSFTFSRVEIARLTLFETSKRRLRSLTSRGRVTFEAVPRRDLERLPGRAGFWRTGGDDPWFSLEPTGADRNLPRGWVRLEAHLAPEGTTSRLDPVLYIGEGNGFDEKSAVPLRVRDGGVEIVTFVSSTAQAFRLDPLSAPGTFSLSGITVTPLVGITGREPSLRRIQASNPGRRFAVDAVPQQHVEAHGDRDDLWRSKGDDPCFYLFASGMTREPPHGWIRIGARLAPEGTTKLDPVLYLDDGKGFREATAVRLRVKDGRIDDTVFVPPTTVGLRLDPMSATGSFSLSDITMTVVSGVRGCFVNLLNVVDALPVDERGAGTLARRAMSFFAETPRAERWQRFVDASRLKIVPASYAAWIDQVEKPARPSAEQMRAAVAAFRERPLISIIMPVYNTPERWLRAALASISAQGYPHWELCLCDDNSSAPHIRPMLDAFAKKEPRVKLHRRTENGRIAVASNDAVAMATGRFMTLMDHDDVIPDNALFEFARLLDEDDTIDFIYSDEDKLTTDEIRYEPFFKPDWSPDYLESCMYTAHLALYRSDLVREVGGFRHVCNGAQDYDFVLRYTERARNVRHIPKILYHWRAIPGSTAQAMDNKDYVIAAAVRALTDRAERTGELDFARPTAFGGCFAMRRKLRERPLISIVIPSAGRDSEVRGKTVDLLAACVASLREKSTYDRVEVVVVDNGDLRPATLAALDHHGARRVTFTDPVFNVAAKMNLGASVAEGDVLVFLNDDVEIITPDWLETMLAILQKPGVGAVGPKLLFENGDLQHAGVTFSDGLPDHVRRGYPGQEPGYYFSTSGTRNYLAVTGACVMVRHADFKAVGGFEGKFAVNYNDVDLCLKLWDRGQRVVYTGQASLYHYESRNRVRSVEAAERELFQERWGARLARDPYYGEWFQHRPPTFELDPVRF